MRDILGKFYFLLMIAFIGISVFSCNYDDALYVGQGQNPGNSNTNHNGGGNNYVDTTVIASKYMLNGFVFTDNNKPVHAVLTLIDSTGYAIVANSTVSASGTPYAMYKIGVDEIGSYRLVCQATGYYSDTLDIVIDGTKHVIVNNIMLEMDPNFSTKPDSPGIVIPNPGDSTVIIVKPNEFVPTDDHLGGTAMVEKEDRMYGYFYTECIPGNNLARIKMEFMASKTDARDFSASAIYSKDNHIVTEVVDGVEKKNLMYIGVQTAYSGGSGTNDLCKITFNLDDNMVKNSTIMYFDPSTMKWTKLPESEIKILSGKIIINTNKVGAFGLFSDFSISSEEIKGDTVFSQHWYNDYNPAGVKVSKFMYTYKMGTELIPSTGLTIKQALMIEYLAGLNGYKCASIDETLDFKDMVLAYDHGLWAYAFQNRSVVKVTSKNESVSAYLYGSINMSHYTYDRNGKPGWDHKGGSND